MFFGTKQKNWNFQFTFKFLYTARTLSVWKSIAHDPALILLFLIENVVRKEHAKIILNFFIFHSDGQDIESQQRWYYDSSDGTCKEFDYLGKKGNGNRFLTRQDCQASCQPSQVERERKLIIYIIYKRSF